MPAGAHQSSMVSTHRTLDMFLLDSASDPKLAIQLVLRQRCDNQECGLRQGAVAYATGHPYLYSFNPYIRDPRDYICKA